MEPVRVEAPLALVSQIQRSGGSLLAQLFDGHPQVYAHPLELRMWFPKKGDWPALDLAAGPDVWFDQLHDPKWAKLAETGFTKAGGNLAASELRYPFTYSADEQRELFRALAAPAATQRDVLDAYFGSFFSAWGEWEPTGRERVLAGFMPRVVMRPASLERFRADYPDGRLITILRDPFSWYASSSRHQPKYREVGKAIGLWADCAHAIAEVADEEWAMGVLFDELVTDPEPVMRRIAAFVGIDFEPSLLVPTFLGRPMLPNSSFVVAEPGVNAAMADRRDQVEPDARAYIEREAQPLYDEVASRLRGAAVTA